MLAMLQDLVHHKWYADARLLAAVQSNEAAANDQETRELLHHIMVSNRFWLATILGKPFVLETEQVVPHTLDEVIQLYHDTHRQEMEWIASLTEDGLEKRIESSFFPNRSYSIAEAYMQVCMHSHGHRAQCLKRLRALGTAPPTLDFILWLKERRPAPAWPAVAIKTSRG